MNRKFSWTVVCCLALNSAAFVGAQTSPPKSRPAGAKDQAIDFERARGLMQKQKRGEKLTADEETYLKRAQAARKKGAESAGTSAAPTPRTSIGVKPLTEMTAEDRYKGQDGGLYGGGRNSPPEEHLLASRKELARIQPLDSSGQPAADGRIVFVSLSMSNATQEFSRFKPIADADPAKSPKVTIVDCAQGGQAMEDWAPPDAQPWKVAEQRLAKANVTPRQVQVAWVKLANKGPSGDLMEHGRKLQQDTLALLHNAKSRCPNLRIVYLSSRIYGGYAAGKLNPEPYAYESAFPARWLIQDQIKGDAALNYDAARGEVKSPLLLWGPYLWADGTTPRAADQLVYSRDDLGPDGTHPSEAGRDKVAKLLLDFFKTDELTKPWFAK